MGWCEATVGWREGGSISGETDPRCEHASRHGNTLSHVTIACIALFFLTDRSDMTFGSV